MFVTCFDLVLKCGIERKLEHGLAVHATDYEEFVMKIVEITRRSYFSASHRLHNPELSEDENLRLYGCCNNKYGHGHNYWLDVTLRGPVDERTGMVMNLDDLNRIIQDEIIAKLDHKHMNHDVDFMSDVIPTAENLVLKIWDILDATIDNNLLHEVRIFESPENSAMCRREQ